ncbi:MAG: efflux RND transporter periplasmic adaptor subunit [Vicinamibacterales bacterium]
MASTRGTVGIVTVLSLLIAGGVAVWLTRAAPALAVSTLPVTSGPIERQILTTGTLEPAYSVQVGSQVGGIVESIEADFNTFVKKWHVLAKLDPSTYQAALVGAQGALGNAQGALQNATVTAESAKANLARGRELHVQRLLDDSDLNDLQVAYDSAAADVKAYGAKVTQAQASVDTAEANLRYTIITSPLDGIVTERDIDVGQTVAAQMSAPTLFVVANTLTHLQLQALIDQADVGGVRAGMEAVFTVDAYPGQRFHGTLSQVRLNPVNQTASTSTTAAATTTAAPAASSTSMASTNPAVVTYMAIIDVTNPNQELRPGMTAVITLPGARRAQAIRIPNRALSFQPPPEVLAARHGAAASSPPKGTARVWKYDGQVLTPILVHPGLSDDTWTESTDGTLTPGEALVTSIATR